ncbi:HET-domain-containing protein [Aspergillus sclerotiicarbonarius CBS 121057]|uniref:HET-domain-containing protein n=1 Tax=Aspergillus sclerotiicarbonarius (strain CBS 121057 / IBT 28362) TaxID=1448318 RepID=A0A319EM06_ASPSB|nr:HET-domain-containing protein [Aspergillus sclerotiicarbonarius CBS 121057]
MEVYEYYALDLGGPSARLLLLQSGEASDELECTLVQAWFDGSQALSYEALSYAWGNPFKSHHIRVNGKHIPITENLFSALQHLRLSTETRILWVDAVCINQNDTRERGHQVQQMKNIYSQAERVIFWLGPGTYETTVILDSLYELEKASHQHVASRNWKLTDERWRYLWSFIQEGLRSRYPDLVKHQKAGMKMLLDQSWFKRIWIVQEVANARSALVSSGSRSVSVHFFVLGPLLTEVEPQPHCQAILDIMPGSARNHSWCSQKRDLYTLLCNFKQSEASDSRDMIYGLLGIASDIQGSKGLQADYNKTEEEVVADAFSFLYGDLFPNTFPEMSKFLDNLYSLNVQYLMAAAKVYNFDSGLGRLERETEVMITNNILIGAAARKLAHERADGTTSQLSTEGVDWRRRSETVVNYLIQHHANCFIITDALVETLAKLYGATTMALLMEKRRGEITLTQKILYAAAEHLSIVDAEAEHRSDYGKELIELVEYILDHSPDHTTIVLDSVFFMKLALNSSARLMSQFLDKKNGDGITIFPGTLARAACNKKDGRRMMELFLLLLQQQHGHIKIDQRVVTAAAGNKYQGKAVMEVLLEQRGNEVEITWPILEKAIQNNTDGLAIMNLLVEKRRSDISRFEDNIRTKLSQSHTTNERAIIELLDQQ